jgi:hypothetical protein
MICIINVNYILMTKHFIIVIIKLSNFIIKLNILTEFADLMNIFN